MGKGIGDLIIRFKVGNWTMIDPANANELRSVGLKATLIEAAVRFKDTGLVAKLIKSYAQRKGISEDKASKKILKDLRRDRKRAMDPISREMLGAVIDFVGKPGELVVTAQPKKPVAFGALPILFITQKKAIKKTLGLKIEAR